MNEWMNECMYVRTYVRTQMYYVYVFMGVRARARVCVQDHPRIRTA